MSEPLTTIRCRCGHTAAWHLFYLDGMGGELPPNHHRCPSCGWQWRRVRVPVEDRVGPDYAAVRCVDVVEVVL